MTELKNKAMLHIHNRILFDFKQNIKSCNFKFMNESRAYHAEWSYSEGEE